MFIPGRYLVALLLVGPALAQSLPSCTNSARTFYPCELSYALNASDLPPEISPTRDEILNVEFRSPSARTYLIRAFSAGTPGLSVRFTPTEPGAWTSRITSPIKRYDGQQATFSVTDSGHPGLVNVANVRHWRSTNKQPHLWLGAELPPFTLEGSALVAWLDARKRDGFSHIRTTLVIPHPPSQPVSPDGVPNTAYFDALDRQLIEVASRGFILDLILASGDFLESGTLDDPAKRQILITYLVARYGAFNLTWQGLGHFDTRPGARELLKDVAATIRRLDTYRHPMSSDALVSSSPLLPDGWMNFLIESSPKPEVGAVEHQFTQAPQIHIVTATDPQQFRAELWNATANGEYPSVSFAALRDESNVRAAQVWQRVVAGTRHWEFEPYFDVSGARASGLDEVEYLAYAQTPGIVEISLVKHKYNPLWINPATGEELELKNYKGEVLSQSTPDNQHDWILQVPRNGKKESMQSYRFESTDPPVQEIETEPTRTPFSLTAPAGDDLSLKIPVPFSVKLSKSNRSTRTMQYLWWGEVVASGEGPRLLATGPSGQFQVPAILSADKAQILNLRVQAINANGKAFEVDKVYQLR